MRLKATISQALLVLLLGVGGGGGGGGGAVSGQGIKEETEEEKGGGGVASTFPLAFTGVVETVAHLVDRTKDYPPWYGRYEVSYDYGRGRAKAVVTHGLDKGKTFLRRYDDKKEYMIRGGEYPACRRSYLGEDMPLPVLPSDEAAAAAVKAGRGGVAGEGVWVKDDEIDGEAHEHWVHDVVKGSSQYHIWLNKQTGHPRRLTDEALQPDGSTQALMTYELHLNATSPPHDDAFDLPQPYTHKLCELHVGGYPYLHLFQHLFRF